MDLQSKIAAAAALLERIQYEYSPATLASSLGAEDMVLTDLIARYAPGIGIFSLDTGRLNPETYELLAKIQGSYGDKVRIEVYYPQAQAIQQYVNAHGINAFYDSVELRKQCCGIRKVEPLGRALQGLSAWMTGLRREQSVTRTSLSAVESDAAHGGIAKINPLAAWTVDDLWAYTREHRVPYNRLYDQGYTSIGCQPCTRAIEAGEDGRAGRWWWELPEHKECGLHVAMKSWSPAI